MKHTVKPVDITTIAGGALVELANEDLRDLLANILDPNTNAGAVRKLTIEVKIKPMQNRLGATFEIQTKATIAPAKGVSGSLLIAPDPTGDVSAYEANPNQMSLDFTKGKAASND